MKHRKTKRKLSNKQAATIIISVLCAAALLIGLLVVIGPILGGNSGGHYEGDGHDHGSSLGDGHYEGDGHNHGTASTTANSNAKVKYQIYNNADKTYRLVFRDNAGKVVAEFNNIQAKNSILPPEVVENNKDVYELGWATGQGAGEFECVYYNVKTGQVSDLLAAPRGTDGVRVAYGSADQKKVIVQDLFDKSYYKEYALADVYTGEGDIIVGGTLQKDNKTVTISYKDSNGSVRHQRISLYE